MYKYYAEQESEDHYLFSGEIADLLYKNYGIANEKGRPATKLVEALLNSLEKEHGIPKLFYNTRHGLRRVYPFGIPLVYCAYKMLDLAQGKHTKEIEGKNYKYQVV